MYAEQDEASPQKRRQTIRLTPTLIQRHLGAQRYDDNFYHREPHVGVALGLAYTQYGGEVMAIECTLIPTGKHQLVLTGKLGDVMKESAQAALSFVRSKVDFFGIDPERLDRYEMHIHVPAGAVPKDGPSAGIAMATAILSALLKTPPKRAAMTGEITIHGKVLPIGGLKEKLLAAMREGVEEVIVPEKNRAMFSELPAQLKRNLKVSFVREYNEVFQVLFESELTRETNVEKLIPRRESKSLAS
jgi:ATP-dependent Lon protease